MIYDFCDVVMIRDFSFPPFQVPSLCSSKGRLIILPSVLYLIIGFIRESARVDENSVVPDLPPGHLTTVATTALQVRYDERTRGIWTAYARCPSSSATRL